MTHESAVMQMTVNETIRRFPATIAVFTRYGIDGCCGGAAAVEEAASRHGADSSALAADLMKAIGQSA